MSTRVKKFSLKSLRTLRNDDKDSPSNRPSTPKQVKEQSEIEAGFVGMYDFKGTLGKGHYATVRLAQHVLSGQRVAVKVIDKTKLQRDELDHMQHEIQVMKLLRHPHVVRLYQVCQTKKQLFLILELADGGDLYERLQKRGAFSEVDAQKYFRQIAEAVAYCHRNHVVHRDLKPENVVFKVTKHGDEVAKVTDFGLSNSFREGDKLKTACGSIAYSCPEILSGDPYDGPPTDVWSLGIILHMMLTKKRPFEGYDDYTTIVKIRDKVYEPPESVSAECRDLLTQLLMKDPKERCTMKKILEHRFVADAPLPKASTQAMAAVGQHQTLTVDEKERVITFMEERMDYSRSQILASCENDAFDFIASTFYLLAEQEIRRRNKPAEKKKAAREAGKTSLPRNGRIKRQETVDGSTGTTSLLTKRSSEQNLTENRQKHRYLHHSQSQSHTHSHSHSQSHKHKHKHGHGSHGHHEKHGHLLPTGESASHNKNAPHLRRSHSHTHTSSAFHHGRHSAHHHHHHNHNPSSGDSKRGTLQLPTDKRKKLSASVRQRPRLKAKPAPLAAVDLTGIDSSSEELTDEDEDDVKGLTKGLRSPSRTQFVRRTPQRKSSTRNGGVLPKSSSFSASATTAISNATGLSKNVRLPSHLGKTAHQQSPTDAAKRMSHLLGDPGAGNGRSNLLGGPAARVRSSSLHADELRTMSLAHDPLERESDEGKVSGNDGAIDTLRRQSMSRVQANASSRLTKTDYNLLSSASHGSLHARFASDSSDFDDDDDSMQSPSDATASHTYIGSSSPLKSYTLEMAQDKSGAIVKGSKADPEPTTPDAKPRHPLKDRRRSQKLESSLGLSPRYAADKGFILRHPKLCNHASTSTITMSSSLSRSATTASASTTRGTGKKGQQVDGASSHVNKMEVLVDDADIDHAVHLDDVDDVDTSHDASLNGSIFQHHANASSPTKERRLGPERNKQRTRPLSPLSSSNTPLVGEITDHTIHIRPTTAATDLTSARLAEKRLLRGASTPRLSLDSPGSKAAGLRKANAAAPSKGIMYDMLNSRDVDLLGRMEMGSIGETSDEDDYDDSNDQSSNENSSSHLHYRGSVDLNHSRSSNHSPTSSSREPARRKDTHSSDFDALDLPERRRSSAMSDFSEADSVEDGDGPLARNGRKASRSSDMGNAGNGSSNSRRSTEAYLQWRAANTHTGSVKSNDAPQGKGAVSPSPSPVEDEQTDLEASLQEASLSLPFSTKASAESKTSLASSTSSSLLTPVVARTFRPDATDLEAIDEASAVTPTMPTITISQLGPRLSASEDEDVMRRAYEQGLAPDDAHEAVFTPSPIFHDDEEDEEDEEGNDGADGGSKRKGSVRVFQFDVPADDAAPVGSDGSDATSPQKKGNAQASLALLDKHMLHGSVQRTDSMMSEESDMYDDDILPRGSTQLMSCSLTANAFRSMRKSGVVEACDGDDVGPVMRKATSHERESIDYTVRAASHALTPSSTNRQQQPRGADRPSLGRAVQFSLGHSDDEHEDDASSTGHAEQQEADRDSAEAAVGSKQAKAEAETEVEAEAEVGTFSSVSLGVGFGFSMQTFQAPAVSPFKSRFISREALEGSSDEEESDEEGLASGGTECMAIMEEEEEEDVEEVHYGDTLSAYVTHYDDASLFVMTEDAGEEDAETPAHNGFGIAEADEEEEEEEDVEEGTGENSSAEENPFAALIRHTSVA